MGYRKIRLEKLKAWDAVGCHHVGPQGTPLGTAHEPGVGYFVVTWALDGSVLSSTGPFNVVRTTLSEERKSNNSTKPLMVFSPVLRTRPSNVMLLRTGGVKLLDFGIARAAMKLRRETPSQVR